MNCEDPTCVSVCPKDDFSRAPTGHTDLQTNLSATDWKTCTA